MQEYVRKKAVRENIVGFLQDIVVDKTKSFVPLMDVGLVSNKNYYFVLHTYTKYDRVHSYGRAAAVNAH